MSERLGTAGNERPWEEDERPWEEDLREGRTWKEALKTGGGGAGDRRSSRDECGMGIPTVMDGEGRTQKRGSSWKNLGEQGRRG